MGGGGQEENLNGNLTAMIDVVFQLIIFFVATTNLQSQAIEDRVRLAMAPHGKALETKDPSEIVISVRSDGAIAFGNGPGLNKATVRAMIEKIRGDSGGTPSVVIRADGDVRHEYVKDAMDACTAAGVWKIKFQAYREAAKKG